MLTFIKSFISQKTNSRLFLICPTWHIEQKLRIEFGENSYFMTALAGLFSFDNAQINQITSLVKEHKINKVCIVANPECRFIGNIFDPYEFYNTSAEDLLSRIYHKKYDKFESMSSIEEKKRALALYKSELQLAILKRNPKISTLLKTNNLKISIVLNQKYTTSKNLI